MEDRLPDNPFVDTPPPNPFAESIAEETPPDNPFVDRPPDNPFLEQEQTQTSAPSGDPNYAELKAGAPKQSLISSIGNKLFGQSREKAANILTMAEKFKLSPSYVEKNYDFLAEEVAGQRIPTTMDLAGLGVGLFAPLMGGGLANPALTTGPVALAKGYAGYEAAKAVGQRGVLPAVKMVQQAINKEDVKYEYTQLRDFMPEGLQGAADVAEFVAYGEAANKFAGVFKGGQLAKAEKLRDDLVAKSGLLPKNVQTGEGVEAPLPSARGKVENINLDPFTSPEVRATIRDRVKADPKLGRTVPVGSEEHDSLVTNLTNDTIEAAQKVFSERGALGAASEKIQSNASQQILEALKTKKGDELRALVDPLIQEGIHKPGEEIGRALQAQQRPKPFIQDVLNGFDQKIREVKATGKGREMRAAVRELKAMQDMVRNGKAPDSNAFDKMYEVFLNGIFSGWETHVVNMVSNTAFLAASPVERLAASGVDKLAGFVTGKREVYPAEASGMARGMAKSLDPRTWGKVPIAEGQKFMHKGAIGTAEDSGIASRVGGKLLRLPTTALKYEDVPFKHTAGLGELYASARAFAKSEGLSGDAYRARVTELLRNPTKEMLSRMSKEELYRTFQTEPDKLAQAMLKARAVTVGGKYIVPVVKTAANVWKAAMERNPVFGPLIMANRAIKGSRGGTPYGQRDFSLDAGKWITGCAATLAVVELWNKGMVTGAAPRDRDEADAFYRQGKQPYSVKLGSRWVPCGRIEPMGTMVAPTINMLDAATRNKKEPTQKMVASMIDSVGEAMIRSPYFQGTFNMFNAIKDPDKAGARVITNILAGMVPFSGAIRTAEKVLDPTLRKPDDQNFLRGLYETLARNIPVLDQTVPAKIDAFGEPHTRPRFFVSKDKHNALEDELTRLGVTIVLPAERWGKEEINRDIYKDINVTTGKILKKDLSELVASPYWKDFNDSQRKAFVEMYSNKVSDQISEKARGIYIRRQFNLKGSKADKENMLEDLVDRKVITTSIFNKILKGKI